MQWNQLKSNREEVLLIILIVIGLFGAITTLELRAEEPRRAIVAMEMLLHKNFIVPKIHSWFYYNKPPLFNWIMAGLFSITGSNNEAWVRFPSITAYLLTAYIIYKVVKFHINKTTAIIAAFLLLLSADTFFYGTVDAGEIDVFYMFVTFIQCIAIFHYGALNRWFVAFLVSYIAAAAGILTKGLPSIAFQGLTLFVWLLYTRDFSKLFTWQHLVSIIMCGVIVSSYFYAYSFQGNLPLYLLQLTNEATQQSGIENKSVAILFNVLSFPFTFFYITFPASALIFYLVSKKVRLSLKQNRLFYFAVLFTVSNIFLYAIAHRTPNRYLYPFFPFVAITGANVYNSALMHLKNYKWLIEYRNLIRFFIVIAFLRIAYDFIVMPHQQRTSPHLVYRRLTDTLLQASRNQPIYLTGFIEKIPADPTLPFISIKADTLTRPPLIPPQIPYYLTHKTGLVMRFDSIPIKGLYYVSPVDFLEGKNVDVHYRFFEFWLQRDMALITFK